MDVVSLECCDAAGGKMAVPTVPGFGVENLQLTDHGHGGLLFLLLDQVHELLDGPQPQGFV